MVTLVEAPESTWTSCMAKRSPMDRGGTGWGDRRKSVEGKQREAWWWCGSGASGHREGGTGGRRDARDGKADKQRMWRCYICNFNNYWHRRECLRCTKMAGQGAAQAVAPAAAEPAMAKAKRAPGPMTAGTAELQVQLRSAKEVAQVAGTSAAVESVTTPGSSVGASRATGNDIGCCGDPGPTGHRVVLEGKVGDREGISLPVQMGIARGHADTALGVHRARLQEALRLRALSEAAETAVVGAAGELAKALCTVYSLEEEERRRNLALLRHEESPELIVVSVDMAGRSEVVMSAEQFAAIQYYMSGNAAKYYPMAAQHELREMFKRPAVRLREEGSAMAAPSALFQWYEEWYEEVLQAKVLTNMEQADQQEMQELRAAAEMQEFACHGNMEREELQNLRTQAEESEEAVNLHRSLVGSEVQRALERVEHRADIMAQPYQNGLLALQVQIGGGSSAGVEAGQGKRQKL